MKKTVDQHATKMEVNSRSLQDEKALFDEDEGDEEDEDGSEEETDEDICEDIRVSSTFFSVFEAVW